MAIHRNGIVSHTGLVLGFSYEHWNDSMDIASRYAKVWNPTTNAPDNVYYADDYTNSDGHFDVDATPDVLAAFAAYEAEVKAKARAYREQQEYARIEVGRVVTVTRGRKVPKGTVGRVFWIGNNGYGDSVGMQSTTGDKYFTAMSNVDRLPVDAAVETRLNALAEQGKAEWKAIQDGRKKQRVNDYTPQTWNNAHRARGYRSSRY